MRVEFEGQLYEFPDGTSDQEIAAALSGRPSARAPSPPQAVSAPAGAAPAVSPAEQPVEPQTGPAMRGLKLGVQNVGRGLANAVFGLGDLTNTGLNLVLAGADKASQAIGGPDVGYRFDMPSEHVTSAAESLAKKLGYTSETPRTTGEKIIANIEDFGTQGLAGASALAKWAAKRAAESVGKAAVPRMADPLFAPYTKNAPLAAAGDTVAGAGGGTGLSVAQEAAPDNPYVSLPAMWLGALGGATAFNAATRTPSQLAQVWRDARPAFDIPLDPETGIPVQTRAANATAQYLQGKAIDPQLAAKTIGENVDSFRAAGLPVPTTGLISGDVGLQSVERGARTKLSTTPLLEDALPHVKEKYGFGSRDTALRDSAVENVNSLRPDGARPGAFPEYVASVGDALRDVAQRGVDTAAGRARGVEIARRGPAEDLNVNAMRGDAASRNIDEMFRGTRTAERERSNALYSAPELTGARVSEAPLTRLADRLQAVDDPRAPMDDVVRKYVDRFRTQTDNVGDAEGRPPLTMNVVNRMRAELEADIQANLSNGETTRQLREFKQTTDDYARQLAEQGNEAARAATQNYAERVRPNFREGAGGRVDATLKSDPLGQNFRPTDMAGEFLTRPEDAADLMRIARLSGREADVAGQARTWLFDRLAQTGVAKDGAIDPEKLTRWRNKNAGVLDAVPGLRAEVDDMVAQARSGENLAARYGAEMRTASSRLADVERAIQRGPIGAVAGNSPENAVKAVFSSKDPVASAAELAAMARRNPAAFDGMKAAFADHFIKKVSGVAPANVSEGTQNVNFSQLVKEFERNRAVLAQVFTPEEMQSLQRAQKALEPLAQRSGQATTGSITAENLEMKFRPVEIALKTYYGGLKGGNLSRNIKILFSGVLKDNEAAAQRLLARSMFDPELAQTLLTRKLPETPAQTWNPKLQKYIRWAETGREINNEGE